MRMMQWFNKPVNDMMSINLDNFIGFLAAHLASLIVAFPYSGGDDLAVSIFSLSFISTFPVLAEGSRIVRTPISPIPFPSSHSSSMNIEIQKCTRGILVRVLGAVLPVTFHITKRAISLSRWFGVDSPTVGARYVYSWFGHFGSPFSISGLYHVNWGLSNVM